LVDSGREGESVATSLKPVARDSALLGSGYTGAPEKITHTVRYSGNMPGGAFFGTVKRSQDGGSLLSEAGSKKKVYMALSDARSEFSVMEIADASQPTYYAIHQIV
jgi:hypothetical protein